MRLLFWFPNAVVLNAVGRRNTQMTAKERKRKYAKERKRKYAKGRKRAQVRKRAEKSANGGWISPGSPGRYPGGCPRSKTSVRPSKSREKSQRGRP